MSRSKDRDERKVGSADVPKLIAYYRVSTVRQGQSGLGLEAQRDAVQNYARSKDDVVAEYTEIESGKRCDRPELDKAIEHTRRTRSTLVIAKLDRLARNVAFLSRLMDDGGCPFVACDLPGADRLTIHILAAVAEDEARRISERTKAGLAVAKKQGKLLGSARPGHWDCPKRQAARRRGARLGNARSAVVRFEKALAELGPLLSQIGWMRESGMSLPEIADELNSKGIPTRWGKSWYPSGVRRVIGLADRAKARYLESRKGTNLETASG